MKRLIALLALTFASPVLAEDNVVVVFDTSGSMDELMVRGQTKMEAAKTALLQVLNTVKPDTNVGVVGFGGWILPLGPVNRAAATKAIQATYASGGTPLGQFMKVGADALLAKRQESHGYGTYTLLVITDGQATDEDLMNMYIPDILARGLVLKTIGVKMSEDHALKQHSVAYYRGDDLRGLQSAISTALAELPASNSGDSADYALIQGIPDEMASKIVTALADAPTLNHPIGEQPPVVKTVDPEGNIVSTAPPVTPAEEGGMGGGAIFLIVLVVFVGVVILIVVVRSLGGGGY